MLVGEYNFDIYEAQFARALRRQGCEVIEVPIGHYIGKKRLVKGLHYKLAFGPGLYLANRKILARARETQPSVVLAWKGWWLAPETLRVLAEPRGRVVAIYNNDDAFGPDAGWRRWKRFRKTIPFADVCFAYREINLEEYRAHGASSVHLLMSGFDPELHRPPKKLDKRFSTEVAFAGHYEPDERASSLLSLAKAGLRMRVYGSDWKRIFGKNVPRNLSCHPPVYGEDYVKAIASAQVGLVFLSSRNRDMYTRRCFEIPAIGTLMAAPRTPVIASLYADGKEALLYESDEELVTRVSEALEDEATCRRIAAAGRCRALDCRYDVDARAGEFLEAVEQARIRG